MTASNDSTTKVAGVDAAVEVVLPVPQNLPGMPSPDQFTRNHSLTRLTMDTMLNPPGYSSPLSLAGGTSNSAGSIKLSFSMMLSRVRVRNWPADALAQQDLNGTHGMRLDNLSGASPHRDGGSDRVHL